MYELKPNTTLQNGVYKILKTIGQGGFGITYLAEMTEISATNSDILESKTIQVAVKEFFIKNEHVRNADGRTVYCTDNEEKKLDIDRWKKKFRREADALKSLNSPNVVKVIELFEENSTAYYSMEYIDGCNLYDYVPSGGLKESDSLALIKKVALALKVLHDKNMLHSDLNPKNIMRRSNGEIVLIDFGLTKLFDEDQNPINSSVSIPAAFPGFAPIEQADFDGSFAPTLDIYALGANLYRLFTGEKPQEAGKLLYNFSTIRQNLTAKGISEKSVAIVEKAMQPKKTDRFQSVDEFLDAIDGKIVEKPPHPTSNHNQGQKVCFKRKVVIMPNNNANSDTTKNDKTPQKTKSNRSGIVTLFQILVMMPCIFFIGCGIEEDFFSPYRDKIKYHYIGHLDIALSLISIVLLILRKNDLLIIFGIIAIVTGFIVGSSVPYFSTYDNSFYYSGDYVWLVSFPGLCIIVYGLLGMIKNKNTTIKQ